MCTDNAMNNVFIQWKNWIIVAPLLRKEASTEVIKKHFGQQVINSVVSVLPVYILLSLLSCNSFWCNLFVFVILSLVNLFCFFTCILYI